MATILTLVQCNQILMIFQFCGFYALPVSPFKRKSEFMFDMSFFYAQIHFTAVVKILACNRW